MYQVAGAVLVASAFLVNQINYATIQIQRAIIDTRYTAVEAADKHLNAQDEHRAFIMALLVGGILLIGIGVLLDVRNRRSAARTAN